MRVFLILFLLPLFNGGVGQAQDILTSQGLQVGDHVPDDKMHAVFNYENDSLSLTDFEGKIIILDFWASWCAPCIRSLAQMDTLQRRFNQSIQIIPVTYEDTDKMLPILSRRFEDIDDVLLPFIYQDNYLRHLFPHRTLPHYVWISKEGRVLAITEGNEVTAENIEHVLKLVNTN